MKILNSNKPVYTMNPRLSKPSDKFEDLFKVSTKQCILILEDNKTFLRKFKKKDIKEIDKTKSFFLSKTIKQKDITSIESSYPDLNFTRNANAADYLVLNSNFSSNFKPVTDYWLGVIELEDKILLLIDRPSWVNYKFEYPGKFYKYLVNNKIIENSTYKMYSSTQYTMLTYNDALTNIEAVLNNPSKIIFEDDLLKTMSDTHEIIEENNLTMLSELLGSKEKESVKLGLRILATSRYMKTPYTIRTLILRNNASIKKAVDYYYGSEFPEISLWNNLHLEDVINFPVASATKGITSVNAIFERDFDISEEDLKLCKNLLFDTYKNSVENLLGSKTKRSLKKAGFKLSLNLE